MASIYAGAAAAEAAMRRAAGISDSTAARGDEAGVAGGRATGSSAREPSYFRAISSPYQRKIAKWFQARRRPSEIRPGVEIRERRTGTVHEVAVAMRLGRSRGCTTTSCVAKRSPSETMRRHTGRHSVRLAAGDARGSQRGGDCGMRHAACGMRRSRATVPVCLDDQLVGDGRHRDVQLVVRRGPSRESLASRSVVSIAVVLHAAIYKP
jgi:hypothetical protein